MKRIRYQAVAPLLSGEGSRAFLGLEIEDEDRARPVVLVWVPEDAAENEDLLGRIERETQHAASLDHPNIVKVYGFNRSDEGAARVVEFADGESLRALLGVVRRLPPHFAALVVADAAMGVHYAQVAGNDDGAPLVHGDLRPETLLVAFSGWTKVSGYGALNVAPREAGGQRVKNRRIYCAPEQVIGGRSTIHPQTDVYLLGLVLYECLTGQVPFDGEEDFDQAVLSKPLPPISGESMPETLQEVVIRATAKKASDRYPTPLAMRQALEDAVGSLPSHESMAAYLSDQFPENEEKRAARRRALDAAIADFARKQWEQKQANPSAAPGPALAALAPPPQPAAASAAAPVAPLARPKPAPRPAAAPDEAEEPTGTRRRTPAAAIALVLSLAIVVAAVAMLRSGGSPASREPSKPLAATTTPENPRPQPVAVAPDAGTPAPGFDAGGIIPAAAVANVDSSPPPPEPPSLQLTVEPSVEVEIDGQPAGRTPLDLQLAPGRHALKLVDRERGIALSRAVTVKPHGKTVERIYVGRGYISVSAPDGAAIFVDGRLVGRAPVKEIAVWEGAHQIRVTVGKAKWQQAFSVRANERMYFNVETQ